MFEPVTLNNEKTIKYGFGWNIGFDKLSLFEHLLGKGENVVSHTGGLSGFGAYNQYDTKDDLYVILLSNQLRPELMNLINDINKALY
jgi:CubicO group peptidase (beta-lactamase class C family)